MRYRRRFEANRRSGQQKRKCGGRLAPGYAPARPHAVCASRPQADSQSLTRADCPREHRLKNIDEAAQSSSARSDPASVAEHAVQKERKTMSEKKKKPPVGLCAASRVKPVPNLFWHFATM